MSIPPALPEDGATSTLEVGASYPVGPDTVLPVGNGEEASSVPVPRLVDPQALQELGTQLESPTVAKDFARDYTRMWEQRYQCLASALDRRDQAESLEAVLSLKTSSAMVGGVHLAKLAGDLEGAIRGGKMDTASALLGEVAQSGSHTVDELRTGYILPDS